MLRPYDEAERGEPGDKTMPLPGDLNLGGLFLIALLTALYFAAEIVWPLVLALHCRFC